MAITFTRRAGKELVARLGEEYRSVTVGTFHSVILRTLQNNGTFPNVLTEKETDDTIVKCLKKIGKYNFYKSEAGQISKSRKEIRSYRMRRGSETPICKAFLSELAINGDTDFDGLLVSGIALARDGKFLWCEHLFVDEAQDNEPLQWDFVYEISKNASVMVVGDIGQSLYGFRGATPEEFSDLEWPTLNMSESFRFPRNIADIANLTNATPLKVVSKKREREVVVHKSDDIVSLVSKLVKGGCDYQDVAVLCRYNNQVFKVREALASKGFPVVVPTIKKYGQLHYLLMYLASPGSVTAREKVSQWMGDKPEIVKYIASDLPQRAVAAAVKDWLTNVGRKVDIILSKIPENAFCRIEREEILRYYAGRTLSDYRSEEAKPEWIAEGDGITVGTVHWAKGGEWPIVILPHLNEGEWPQGRGSDEELRVFYVAITRTIEQLHVMYSQKPSPYLDFF
jgi:superfamily I DNA/RNA helicase